MRCIVTAGPTYEELDRVRRLTNMSTGRLGTELAGFLKQQGHEVVLLIGEQSTWRGERLVNDVQEYSTTSDLEQKLKGLGGETVGAVFHAAAVSDFAFGKVFNQNSDGELNPMNDGKISTRSGTLLAELVPTPKLISSLAEIFSKAFIWKRL